MWSSYGYLPKSGAILTVKELSERCINAGDMQDASVRINGRLVESQVNLSLAKVLDRDKRFHFWVDTTLIEPFESHLGATIQLVGEIQWRKIQGIFYPSLKARTVRCVDDMDLIRYEKALEIQRNFLQEESVNSSI